MTKKLYVGDLWFEATEAELKKWFGQSGPVEMVHIIPDRVSDKDIAEINSRDVGGQDLKADEPRAHVFQDSSRRRTQAVLRRFSFFHRETRNRFEGIPPNCRSNGVSHEQNQNSGGQYEEIPSRVACIGRGIVRDRSGHQFLPPITLPALGN